MKLAIGLLVAGLAAMVSAESPSAERARRGADEAMHAFLRTKDPAQAAHLIAEERKFLEIGALRSPDELVVADVLLKRGVTGVGIRALLEPRELTLAGMTGRVRLASGARVVDLNIGQRDILRIPARTLDERADLAMELVRYQFDRSGTPGFERADSTFESQIAELRARTTSPQYSAHRLRVVGTRSQLFTLLRHASVHAVFVNRDRAAIEWLMNDRQEFEKHVERSAAH